MVSLVEKLKSITDLIFGLEAVVFAAVCFRASGKDNKERHGWAQEFLGVAAAAFLGYYLHGFSMSGSLHTALWFILYVVMFSITLGIYLLLMPHLGNAQFIADGETRFIRRCYYILLVITEILLLLQVDWDIYGFALYAIMLAVSLVKKTIRGSRKDPRFLLSVLLMLLGAVSQGFKFIFSEYAVVAAHCFIIAALALLFDFAMHVSAAGSVIADEVENFPDRRQ